MIKEKIQLIANIAKTTELLSITLDCITKISKYFPHTDIQHEYQEMLQSLMKFLLHMKEYCLKIEEEIK